MTKWKNGFSGVSLCIDATPEMNNLLGAASARACRSKSKEATLRLTDHINNFPMVSNPGIHLYGKTTAVVVHLTNETNTELEIKAVLSGRTKTKEAYIRLQDHLRKVTDIACLGKRFEKL